MLDLAKWCQRAITFTEALRGFPGESDIHVEVGTPIALDRIQDLSVQCPFPIPETLINWYQSVGSCHCTYSLDIPTEFEHEMKLAFPNRPKDRLWGGADLIDISDTLALPNNCREIAAVFQEDGFANDARLWGNTFPLIRESNGDLIGLYIGDNATDPTVAYLCHELCGASKIISLNFESFLRTWEELRYIGCHYLQCFINPKTGFLDSKNREAAVQALKSIFQATEDEKGTRKGTS